MPDIPAEQHLFAGRSLFLLLNLTGYIFSLTRQMTAPHHHTDHSLIVLWQQGDESAFNILYKRYVLSLLELVTRKTGSPEYAREIVQDCFLAIYLAKDRLHLVDNFRAYAFTIARNKIFSFYRHELVKQKYRHQLPAGSFEQSANDVRDWLDNRELQELIRHTIEKMPPKCRAVFRLSREERLSQKAIAAQLSISENTVEQHIRKALRILREAVDDYNQCGGVALGLLLFLLARIPNLC
jgi:RNA polymerase sigma-70 factor (ECF subfamily)